VWRSLALLDRSVQAPDMAALFALHRRTLDRRLRLLGTSFHAALDDIRLGVPAAF
jgi:hypothetical protein